MNRIKEVSCGGILFKRTNGQVLYLLLQHTGAKHWSYPKGKKKIGETCEEAARREIIEETGHKNIKILRKLHEKTNYSFLTEWRTIEIFKTVHWFLVESQDDEVILSKEHENFRWLPFDEALKLLTHENSKPVLREANKYV